MVQMRRTHSLIFMLFILLIAAALRLPDLPDVPPGLHYDEAANGLLSADIGLRGSRPVFIASYTGKETLFFYLAGGLMRLVGDSVFTLRLTAVFVGVLTIAATYWLGRELLRDRRVALLAAALLAVSFWHLLFSRLGFRAVTQPLLQALTAAALLRGVRRPSWGWLSLAGVFLGVTAYTYLAARLFPIVLALAALPLLFNRRLWRQRWGQLGVTAAIGSIVLVPLAAYFISHPDAFWVRIGQVAPTVGGLSLGESYLKSLGMFFLSGDPFWRFNWPLRPLFNWFWGGFLVVGWVGLVLRWRHLAADWQRSAALWLLITPFLMILPTALATNEIVPSNLRAIGLIPFIFYLPPVGLFLLLDDVTARRRRRMTREIEQSPRFLALDTAVKTGFLIGLILFVGGGRTWRDYFQRWAVQPALFYENDGDLTAVASFIDALDSENKRIYVAALHYQHPTLAFLSQKYGQVNWLPQSRALVLPATGTAVYIYPHNSPQPEWTEPFLAAARPLSTPTDTEGRPIFTAYEMAALPSLPIPNPVDVDFGGAVTLLGYETAVGAVNETLPLTLYWRVDNVPSAEVTPFVHLEDRWGYRWGQVETFAYPSAQWQPGEIIIQRVDVPAPPGTPPGVYRLRVGLFAPATGERLPRLDAYGRYAGDSVIIEKAPIVTNSPPDRLPPPPFAIDESVRSGLRLLGYGRGGETAVTGETIHLALWWLAGQSQPYLAERLELHPAAGGPGRIIGQTRPVHDTFSFDEWATPIFLIDHVDGRIPNDMPAGRYTIRLRILDAADKTMYTTDLGQLTIEVSQRLFTPPPVQQPLDALFGHEITLLGYDLDEAAPNQVTLTLVWQAETAPAADYTVFVHLLAQDGVCCLWQADAMPQQNQAPTSRWLAGEIVVDTYQIALPEGTPPGDYLLEVGLYMAENGRRLQVTIPHLPDSDAALLPLSVSD